MPELFRPLSQEYLSKQIYLADGDRTSVYRLVDDLARVLKVAKFPRHPEYAMASFYAHRIAKALVPDLFPVVHFSSPTQLVADYVEGHVQMFNKGVLKGANPGEYPPEILEMKSKFSELQRGSFLRDQGIKAKCLDFYGGESKGAFPNFEYVNGHLVYLDSLEVIDSEAVRYKYQEIRASREPEITADPSGRFSYSFEYVVKDPEKSSNYESIKYDWSIFDEPDVLYAVACANGGEELGERVFSWHDRYLDHLEKVVRLGKF